MPKEIKREIIPPRPKSCLCVGRRNNFTLLSYTNIPACSRSKVCVCGNGAIIWKLLILQYEEQRLKVPLATTKFCIRSVGHVETLYRSYAWINSVHYNCKFRFICKQLPCSQNHYWNASSFLKFIFNLWPKARLFNIKRKRDRIVYCVYNNGLCYENICNVTDLALPTQRFSEYTGLQMWTLLINGRVRIWRLLSNQIAGHGGREVACFLFARSEAVTVGSNPTQGIDV
jgi:hypothetical protein